MTCEITYAPPRTRLIRYQDPVENFSGYLAFHGFLDRLAAGGIRVQRGLTADTISSLAEAMWLKQRLLGLAVDGAKAGINYDPSSPGMRGALRRFLRFLRPYLIESFSAGPDMGTTFREIETLARAEGLLSAKIAIARAQGLSETEFLRRIALLEVVVGGATLGERRAGHALACAALSTAATLRLGGRPTVAIQGFGTLGRGAAHTLVGTGAKVVALADETGCRVWNTGLRRAALSVAEPRSCIARQHRLGGRLHAAKTFFELPADILVLAACERSLPFDYASRVRARAVVVGANLGLDDACERRLHQRAVFVLPDFVGGCGGSAAMAALFGPPSCPSAEEVLGDIAARMDDIVRRVHALSLDSRLTPREAALALCELGDWPDSRRPYGSLPIAA